MAASDPYMVQPLRKQRTDTMGSLQSRTSSLVPVTTFGSGRLVWRLTSNPESYVVSEGRLDVAMHTFLVERKVHYTSIDPVRIGIVSESVAPIIIWVGVEPGSLSAERGIKELLLASGLSFPKTASRTSTSRYVNQWSLPLPRCTSNPTVEVREAFSTTLYVQKGHLTSRSCYAFLHRLFHAEEALPPRSQICPFAVDEENDHYE